MLNEGSSSGLAAVALLSVVCLSGVAGVGRVGRRAWGVLSPRSAWPSWMALAMPSPAVSAGVVSAVCLRGWTVHTVAVVCVWAERSGASDAGGCCCVAMLVAALMCVFADELLVSAPLCEASVAPVTMGRIRGGVVSAITGSCTTLVRQYVEPLSKNPVHLASLEYFVLIFSR